MPLATVTPPIAGVEIRDRAEAVLQGALATTAPTVGQSAPTPIFGTFPRPGHLAFTPQKPTADALTLHLFAR